MASETKVLIIDDDEVILFLHDLIVKDSGFASEPVCFGDGRSAVEYLEVHQGENERYLVFLDLNMAKMNGWQFLDAIVNRPYADRLSVVIVTSSIDYMDHQQAKQYEQVIDYVEKPLSIPKCTSIREQFLGQIEKN